MAMPCCCWPPTWEDERRNGRVRNGRDGDGRRSDPVVMFGYHGRYLRIGAHPGETDLVALDEATLRDFLGGVGLGTWILAHENPSGADPLGPGATLVFALSPLVGSPLT